MLAFDVELRDVTKRFGGAAAVDGVSLGVEPGQFLTLLGPSGCGKTTTLRLIGGFELPDAGEVYLRGEPMGQRPPYRRETSMVFQNFALFPHMSIRDNIGYGLKERKISNTETQRRVEAMLQLVALPGLGDRKPQQLSGGQQQRVALARSLVIEPTVLLLDEPLGALDLQLRRQMQLELMSIQSRVGITFIYVTHDQEEALTMSDRIAVMNAGKVEQVGSSREIFERPATRFVAAFMGAENILAGEVVETDGALSRVRVAGTLLTLPGITASLRERVDIVIRPENLRLVSADDSSVAARDVIWDGKITSRLYKGSSITYRLTLTSGDELVVDVPRSTQSVGFDPGDAVQALLRPQDAVVIPGANDDTRRKR
jgi:spermidine/putrescine transport system ATP-binding protein